MKNSLVNKVKEGAKQIGKKALPYIIAGAGVIGLSTLDVDAQENVYSYDNHNTGATIEKDQIRVEDGKYLEVKMLNGRGEYFQNIPLEVEDFPNNPKKITNADIANTFKDTLNVISFSRKSAQYDLDAFTKGFLEVSSKEAHNWTRARDENGDYLNVIPLSLKKNPKTGKPEIFAEILCDKQLNKKNGMGENASYIAKENLEEILKQLTSNLNTLNLNRVINDQLLKTNLYFPSATDSTVYLIPNIEGYTKLRILSATENENGVVSRARQVAIVSPLGVYEKSQGDLDAHIDNVPTSSVSGTAETGYHDEDIQTKEKVQKSVETDSTKTKRNLYLIAGVNANDKFVEGQFGIQFGPVALVGNYGQGKDETVKDFQTAPFPDGTSAYGKMDNKNIKILGASFELHPLHKRKVSPFVGAGINKWDYITEVVEQMRDANNNVMVENTNSKTVSENSYKGYTGLNFKIGEKSQLGVQAGFDTKAKFNAGVRFTRKF